MKSARIWLSLSAVLCAAALADPPALPPPAAADAPDEDFIEFLGTDDVGDAAWWEFLTKSAPLTDQPPPKPPPQDAKQ